MIELFADDAQSTLAGAITSTALTAALSPGSGALFPTPGANQFFRMTFRDQATMLQTEIVFVTARSGDVITMLRAQESTVAQAWSAGDIAANLCTAGAMGGMTQLAALPLLLTGIIGESRNMQASQATAGTSITYTADQIIAATALNGSQYLLPSFNHTLNLATVGIGGMDTGLAPVSGFVAVYAAYNPTTNTQGIFATNAATAQGMVYGGANAPAGFTVTALIGVLATNASRQIPVLFQYGRKIVFPFIGILSTTTAQVSIASLSIIAAVPLNAKSVSGTMACTSSAAATTSINVYANIGGAGQQGLNISSAAVAASSINFVDMFMSTPQTIFWQGQTNNGIPTLTMSVTGYTV